MTKPSVKFPCNHYFAALIRSLVYVVIEDTLLSTVQKNVGIECTVRSMAHPDTSACLLHRACCCNPKHIVDDDILPRFLSM